MFHAKQWFDNNLLSKHVTMSENAQSIHFWVSICVSPLEKIVFVFSFRTQKQVSAILWGQK